MSGERALRQLGDDRGSAAAELALALPAVLLTLLFGVGALTAAAQQVRLQDAAADAARLLGRGQSTASAVQAVAASGTLARFTTSHRDQLVCVTAHGSVAVNDLISLPLQATSCALEGGM